MEGRESLRHMRETPKVLETLLPGERVGPGLKGTESEMKEGCRTPKILQAGDRLIKRPG